MALPAELTSVDPLAEEAWGYALGDLHYPAFDREALGRTVRRHAVGEEWIRTAVASRNPRQPAPAAHFGGTSAVPPLLLDSLRPLLRAFELQRFIDAVETGDERAALALVSPGNRYLLARSVDGAEGEDPARVRWAIDQVAGMPIGRRGDYLGLSHPPALPQGEVGDDLRDPHLYDRLLDIRIRMAIEIERQGLPSALAARLLPEAMAHVLSQAQPLTVDRWRGIVDALERELSGDDLRGWMLDLAFADELLLPGESVAPERRQ
jgi:hypothetical protein